MLIIKPYNLFALCLKLQFEMGLTWKDTQLLSVFNLNHSLTSNVSPPNESHFPPQFPLIGSYRLGMNTKNMLGCVQKQVWHTK